MKSNVEIITGFLEGGKTTLINSLIEETTLKEEEVVIIQLEEGNTIIKENINQNIKVINFEEELSRLSDRINEIITLYKPKKIFIEFNGTENIDEFLNEIYTYNFKKSFKLGCIYFICNIKTIESYMKNMAEIINPFIENSNLIIVNNSKLENKDKINKVRKELEYISKSGHIIFCDNNENLSNTLKKSGLFTNLFLKKIYYKFKG